MRVQCGKTCGLLGLLAGIGAFGLLPGSFTLAGSAQETTGWVSNAQGEWQYYLEDGQVAVGQVTIDGQVYSFAPDGILETGWQSIGGNRYYYDPETGAAAYGLLEYRGSQYYISQQGKQTGLQTILNPEGEGTLYYFSLESGQMLLGHFQDPDGNWYNTDETGAVQTGTVWIDGIPYPTNEQGIQAVGWVTLDGSVYYVDPETGRALLGWQEVDGQRYHFGNDGVLTTGMHQIGGSFYFFSEEGLLQTGWQTQDGNWYYFQEDGTRIATGWQVIDGKRYYFYGTGRAAVGTIKIDGDTYSFSEQTRELESVLLDVEYLSQAGYPTGCESASAVMLLRDYGYSISIRQFIDSYLDRGELYWQNGTLYGPDPNQAFVGSPYYSTGYGCYAPVIVNAMNRILTGTDQAIDLTGTSLSGLCTQYLDQGHPVLVWATINMVESSAGTRWVIPETGTLFTWKRSEHCLVLVGYDSQYYYMNDPYQSNGLKAYSRSTVEARYATMGYQAVAIVQGETVS